MRDILVYVAGPLSQGNVASNVRRACEVGMTLMKAKLSVLVPHLSVYLGQQNLTARFASVRPETNPGDIPHADWYAMSCHLVRRCCAVLRLPGESTGADLEVAEARKHGIPVFGSVAEVIAWSERLSETANADGTSGGGSQDDSAIQRP